MLDSKNIKKALEKVNIVSDLLETFVDILDTHGEKIERNVNLLKNCEYDDEDIVEEVNNNNLIELDSEEETIHE